MIVNKVFKTLYESDKRFNISYGGAGSSKSYSMAQLIVLGCTQKKVKWLILRKYAVTLKDSVFAILKEIIEDSDLSRAVKINKSEKSITFPNGSVVIMSGVDDPEKLKSIHGVDKVWIEESTELLETDFNQIILRLRGQGEKRQFYLTFNPVDEEHWIKSRFIDVSDDRVITLHSTYKDNAFLDDDYIEELERLKEVDHYYYEVYCLGKWGNINNTNVFNNYIFEDLTIQTDDLKNIVHGMDFGFNHASTLISLGFHDGEIYVFNEIYEKGLTNQEFMTNIIEMGFNKRNLITAESAEPDRIKDFSLLGFNIKAAKKGQGSLMHGIDFLKSHRIHINKNCPNTFREIKNLKYRQLKDGIVLDQIVERDDDCIAGMRYATEHLWHGERKVSARKLKPSQLMSRR